MKPITRRISLLLCLSMLLGLMLTAIGCGKADDANGEQTTTPGADQTTTGPADTSDTATTTTAPEVDPYEPAEENFGDANGNPTDFTIAVRAGRYGYLFDDGTSAERVNSAAYQRNAMIEERYNIKIGIVEIESTADAWNTSLLTSDGAYDLACFDYWWGIEQNGLMYDLMSLPEIDVTDPHWYSGWNDNVTINNKLFSIAGDATLEILENIEILFFNKDMAEAYKLDLYQTVEDGKWTLDKMKEINVLVAENLDNDQTADDIYGALYDVHSVPAQLYAAGLQLSQIQADGSIAISSNKEQIVSVTEAVTSLLHSGGVRYDSNTARSSKNQGLTLFTNGSAMFYATALYLGQSLRSANTAFDYGVLVPPKFDEASEYITSCYGASLFGIPLSVKDVHRSAVILDAINYYSNDTVVDAFYEIVLKYQVADSEEDANMIQMARDTLYVEFAFIQSLSSLSSVKNAAINNTPIASALAATLKVSQNELKKLTAAYQ